MKKVPKRAKTLKKHRKKNFEKKFCVGAFTREGKISLMKKSLFYANIFEFEVKTHSPFWGVASISLSILYGTKC